MAIKYSTIGGSTGTGFNVQVGSKYSYATFTTAQPAGAYTIKSSNNYTNWDVYLLDASNNLVAYTGTASISPVSAFSAIVVVNGTVNDILQFSFQSTVFATATTSQTKAGPFITAFGSSVIPNKDSAVTITGGNFAVGITATFTGTDSVIRTCKSVVYNSNTSISVVRPDILPVTYAPYVLTLTNPGVNNPVTSGANILTGLTVGSAPTWTTGTSLSAADPGTSYSATVVAIDPDAGGSIAYSYVSGALPTGLSFNASTGVISGTYSGSTNGSTTYTVRATDSGGNFTDRTFTINFTSIAGGTLVTSDTTYYYRVFTSNGTFQTGATIPVDIFAIAGGGSASGGTGGVNYGAGGGAGTARLLTSQSLTGSYAVAVGGGGIGVIGAPGAGTTYNGTNASPTSFGSLINASGGTTPNTAARTGGSNSDYSGATLTTVPQAGGGAGAGANGSGLNGGNGYNGISSWLTAITSTMSGISGWGTATSGGYIGGGGGSYDGGSNNGGTGGLGGGGQSGSSAATPQGGITNTGSGSAGGNSGTTPPNGGSGLVILRYTKASVGG